MLASENSDEIGGSGNSANVARIVPYCDNIVVGLLVGICALVLTIQ